MMNAGMSASSLWNNAAFHVLSWLFPATCWVRLRMSP